MQFSFYISALNSVQFIYRFNCIRHLMYNFSYTFFFWFRIFGSASTFRPQCLHTSS